MKQRKNALVLFSKVPEPGRVKTRLSVLKDGLFSPEVASALYHCMFFDVVEICCAALTWLEERSEAAVAAGAQVRDTYELIVSTAPADNLEAMRTLFEESGEWPRPIVFAADRGASFDEHYNDAFAQAWERGADTILSMGADMPALTVADVVRGFEALHELDESPDGGVVLAPDQEMGVSIVGWTRATDFDHTGVYYNPEGLTVLPAYIAKAREAGLPVRYLPPVPDVDTLADLRHAVTLVEALMYSAPFDGNCPPWRTAQALADIGWTQVRIPPNALHDPRDGIDV